MKSYKIVNLSTLLILLLSGTTFAHTGHSDDPRRTWSDEISVGDTFSFDVETYTQNDDPVTSGEGVTEGSSISVEILGNLTEIDLSSFEGILLTDYSDYFQVTVDESSSEKFDTSSAFLFVYPNIRDNGDGEITNIFQESVENDTGILLYPFVSQVAVSIDGDDFIAELVTQDVSYEYNYDLETGLLNSYTETEGDTTISISSSFSTDRLAPLPILFIISGIIVISTVKKLQY